MNGRKRLLIMASLVLWGAFLVFAFTRPTHAQGVVVQVEPTKTFDQVVNDPKSSSSDIGKAYSDELSSSPMILITAPLFGFLCLLPTAFVIAGFAKWVLS